MLLLVLDEVFFIWLEVNILCFEFVYYFVIDFNIFCIFFKFYLFVFIFYILVMY